MKRAVSQPAGYFVTSTGTGQGKTIVSLALVHAFRQLGLKTVGLKPLETGVVDGVGEDARALALASGDASLASTPGLYRSIHPLAPQAAAIMDREPAPRVADLVLAMRAPMAGADMAIVEGAGGVLVPLNKDEHIADLASELGLPCILVAQDVLGVLSHVLTAAECLRARGLTLDAVMLVQTEQPPRVSREASNVQLLSQQLRVPVLALPWLADPAGKMTPHLTATDWFVSLKSHNRM